MDIHRVWTGGVVAVAVVGLAGCGGGHRSGQAEAWCRQHVTVGRTTENQIIARLGPPDQAWPAPNGKDINGRQIPPNDVLAYGAAIRFSFATDGRHDRALEAKVCDQASLRKVEAWVAKKP